MADFFNRLVSRTLSGLEPTVKPLIAPMYALGVTMADNYATDTSLESDLSASTEYDPDESLMEQSQELLGTSATETLNSASNLSLINFGEIQPQDNSSEIIAGEQIEPDSAIAPEVSSRNSLSESLSPPITTQQSSSLDTVKVTPTTVETIQPQDNSSEITDSEEFNNNSAIASEASSRDNLSEASSSPIASSTIVQKSSSPDTVKITPTTVETIQPQDNSSEITSSEQIESDSAIASEASSRDNLSESSSPPITTQQSSSPDTVKVTPTTVETIQPQDNSSEITDSEEFNDQSAIEPKTTSRDSLSEASSSPINLLTAPSTIVQKSTSPDTVKVTPATVEAIQPQDNSSEITDSEEFNDQSAIASEATTNDSLSEASSSPINPSIASSTIVQKSTSSKVNPTARNIQPTSESKIERSQTLGKTPSNSSSQLVESQVKFSNYQQVGIAPQITTASSSSGNSSAISPLDPKLNSQFVSKKNSERENVISPELKRSTYPEDNPLAQLNNQSSPERSSKVSLPLVKSAVIAPLSSSPLNSPEQIQPPVNRIELTSSIEIDPALESNIPATSNSLTSSPSSQSREAQVRRSPIASETGSQSSNMLQNQTREIKPQSNFLENNPLMSSSGKPDPSLLRITNQFNPVKQEVTTQQISVNQGEIITSNLNNQNNSRNNLSFSTDAVISRPSLDKSLARIDPIPAQIKPRLEITSQEIAQTPGQSSDFANFSSSPPSSSQLSPTGRRETLSSNQISGMIATAESTPTINITIGRVEVRGIKPPEPPPMKKSRAKTPQLSLSDYLDQRGRK